MAKILGQSLAGRIERLGYSGYSGGDLTRIIRAEPAIGDVCGGVADI